MTDERAYAYTQEEPERWTVVKAHGTAVGLPSDDDMGNSGGRFCYFQSFP